MNKEMVLNEILINKDNEKFVIKDAEESRDLKYFVVILNNKKMYNLYVAYKSGYMRFENYELNKVLDEYILNEEKEKKRIEKVQKERLEMRIMEMKKEEEKMNRAIKSFRGDYHFLSNFYKCTLTYKGITFTNVEAAFQGQKDLSRTLEFKKLSPSIAKKLGRNVNLRSDWEDVKLTIMEEILRCKFNQNPILKNKLIATGNRLLIEGNNWNDIYWGVCGGKGENNLERFIEYKPIRIGNKYYKFNKNYIVPVTVLIQNPKIYQYADIPVRYVLGNVKQVFHYDVSEKTLNKIKRFDTNITGISLENIIYSSLGAVEKNNSSFLIKNKMQLEKIATIERNINEIPITIREDGLVEAVDEKDREFIEEVNDVALAIKNELKSTFEFIKNNIFVNEEILSQELVLSENDKVLALCDLSSKSAVMEIKTVSPSVNNIGYLDPKITYQLYYQAKKRSAYYLHIFIGGGFERPDNSKTPRYCSIDISKIELNEYTKDDYEKMICKLTTQEEMILEFIKKNPNCQYKDLELAFPNYSRRMIEQRIKSLEKKRHIIRVGNKRVYHWECIDKV